MTKQIIESLLAPIRAMIMKSRPAYKDYLGEETVEETRVLVSGTFNEDVDSSVTLTEGETYLVNIDGVEQEMAAQDVSLIMVITRTPMTVYGFSNVDISKQIIVSDGYVFAGISRANQPISIYHGETLVADCTMPSTGIEAMPTAVLGESTVHDETFTGFVEGETYTIVAGDEPPITGFVIYEGLFSFDLSACWYILSFRGKVGAQDGSNSRTNYTISQKITTTKKRYDIKRLPEELLPKTVATKGEVRTAQTSADAAQSTAESAQSTATGAVNRVVSAEVTAVSAKSTAVSAKSTAEMAKSAADSVAASAVKTADGYSYVVDSRSADRPYPEISLRDYSQNRSATVRLDESVGLVLTITRDGGSSDINTTRNPATIKMNNMGGSGGVIVDGLRSLIMTSSTPNSTKKFKITVDDSGVISATEVVE